MWPLVKLVSIMPAEPRSQSQGLSRDVVAIVGAGSIGAAWALVFAQADCLVRLYDTNQARLPEALSEVAARLADLESFGLLQEPPQHISSRVTTTSDLPSAVEQATYVQECASEQPEVKRALFAKLDALAPSATTLASSSSFMPASRFASDLPGRARVLLVHPGNPPYLLRVAEVVPAPFTSDETVRATMDFLSRAAMQPVLLNKEIDGFLFNRLQGAVLREAYSLVRDGVASVHDIDRIVRDGLGLRWSVLGPFETADLNTRGGLAAHAERMGPAYIRMASEPGRNDPWSPELVAAVTAQRRQALPLEDWPERVAMRDRALMALLRCRRTEPDLKPFTDAPPPPAA